MRVGKTLLEQARRLWVVWIALLLVFSGVAGLGIDLAISASATTWTVTNCDDSGPGSLRQAIADANSGDTIAFAMSPSCSTIILTSGGLDLASNIDIEGPGADDLAVSASGTSDVFNIASGVTAEIFGLTIEDGIGGYMGGVSYSGGINNDGSLTVSYDILTGNSAPFGGGIDSQGDGSLTVTNSTLSDNSSAVAGGAIANYSVATIADTTISGNSAPIGGGIYNVGTLTLSDSTVAGNTVTSTDNGGGISNDNGTMNISNSTMSGNVGGGIDNSQGTVSIAATIVANSSAGADCSGDIVDAGFNLDDDGSCAFSGTSLSDTAAGLDPSGLVDNGGPTQTIALEADSPAIGAVTSAPLCATPDQRGVVRPTPCDIGAYQTRMAQAITYTSLEPSDAVVGGQTYTPTAVGGGMVMAGSFALAGAASAKAEGAGSAKTDTKDQTTYTVPSNVPTGCSADAAPSLTEWLASLPSGATAQLEQGACYLVDEWIELTQLAGITIDGNGATVEMPAGEDQATFLLTQDTNLTIEDLTIASNNIDHTYTASDAFEAGVEVDGGDGITLTNLTMTNIYGDFVTLDPHWPHGEDVGTPDPATDVTISDNTFNGSGRMGIGLVDCDEVTIENNSLNNVALNVFDLEASYAVEGQENVTILDNTTGSSESGGVWLSNAGNGVNSTGDITVIGNTMLQKDAGEVVLVAPPANSTSGPWTIEDNTLFAGDSAYMATFQLSSCVPCTVMGNTVYFPAGSTEALFGGTGSGLTESDNILVHPSGIPVVITVDAASASVCSISDGVVSFIGSGICTLDANEASDANYQAATQVQQSFIVGQGSQAITFTTTPPSPATAGGLTYIVAASGGASGNSVVFSSASISVCTISDSTVTFVSASICTIDANQAGNANYLAAPTVTQSFAVINGPDAITSPADVTATVGTTLSPPFTIYTTGTSSPTLKIKGSLPEGLTFVDNNDGTATISGTPAANTGRVYVDTIEATFGSGKTKEVITQAFTLIVDQAPAIMSGAPKSVHVGTVLAFNVKTKGFPISSIAESGPLPDGVTFTDNRNGTATLAGTPASGSAGTFPITITASNGVGNPATQNFSLVVKS